MATVTILLPTYSRAHFLPFAIESALTQTHRDIQLVILDDASPDNTAEVVRPYLSDPRVRYVRHPRNLGITGNWRAGLSLVDTEFFCLLEDDDVFGPHFIERLLKPLQADPQRILSFCDHWAIDAGGNRDTSLTERMTRRFGRHRLRRGPIDDLARSALIDGSVGITAAVFRAEYISPDFIRDEAGGGIDFWLFYQCARTGRRAFYVPDRLMSYRLHGAGMSHSMPETMAKGHLFLYRSLLQDTERTALHPAARGKLHEIAASYGIHLLMANRTDEAAQRLAEALRHGFSPRAAVAYRLALWEKGRSVASVLRQAKQRGARILLPLLLANLDALRVVKHAAHGLFFRR